jgi:hypothetical protein
VLDFKAFCPSHGPGAASAFLNLLKIFLQIGRVKAFFGLVLAFLAQKWAVIF